VVALEEKLKAAKGIKKIKIDAENQTISFQLSVNQYLDVTKLAIYEGDFDLSALDTLYYYDPAKPEDRFVPLEEADKAAEARKEAEESSEKADDENLELIKPTAIDEDEEEIESPEVEVEKEADVAKPAEAKNQ